MTEFSDSLRLVITRHEAHVAEGISIPVYNWKVQRRSPKITTDDGCLVKDYVWRNHILMLSQPETLSADELVETLGSWKLTDANLLMLPIVKEWEITDG